MPLDFGFYDSLRAKEDLGQRRQDDANILSIATQMRDESRQHLERNAQAQDAIQQYEALSKQEMSQMLDQDKKRFSDAELKQREGLIQDLANHGNDPDLWMLMGGKAKLDKYASDIQNMPELQQGILNKQNMVQAIKDRAEGKIWRGDFASNVADFNSGKTDKINYQGAFEKPDLSKFIEEAIKTPPPKGEGEYVSRGLLQQLIASSGKYSPADAQQILNDPEMQHVYTNPQNPKQTNIPYGAPKPVPQYDFRKSKEYITGGYADKVKNPPLVSYSKEAYDFIKDKKETVLSRGHGTPIATGATDDFGKPIKQAFDKLVKNPDGSTYMQFLPDTEGKILKVPITNLMEQYIQPVYKEKGGVNSENVFMNTDTWLQNGGLAPDAYNTLYGKNATQQQPEEDNTNVTDVSNIFQ